MREKLTVLFLLIALCSFGQQVRVDTLKLTASGRWKEMQADQMNYPVVRTGNDHTDSLINQDVIRRITYAEYPVANIDSAITALASSELVFLNFMVTYNDKDILSFNISGEACRANCSGWTEYFNYSIKSGLPVDISSIVDTTKGFRKKVIRDKTVQYEKYRNEMKVLLSEKGSGVDSSTYHEVIENYNACDSSFRFENYAVYTDHLEIVEECFLPHYMRSYIPSMELKYMYTDIRKYLRKGRFR